MTAGNSSNAGADIPPVTLPDSILQEMKSLISSNRHCEAYEVVANAMCFFDLMVRFQHLYVQQLRKGALDAGISQKRRAAFKRMLEQAKPLLSPAQYEQVHACAE